MPVRGSRTVFFLFLIVVAALAMRLPQFATRTLWFDEVYQVYVGSAPSVGEMFERVRLEERCPPLFYLFTRACLMFGPVEWAARLPSLLTGLGCIVAAFAAGRVWVGRSGAWALALWTAFSPVYVFYSREARCYMPGVLVVWLLLAAAGWYRLAHPAIRPADPAQGPPKRSSGRMLLFALAAAAAAGVQYAGAVVTAILMLSLLLAGPRWCLGGWLLAGVASAAIFFYGVIGFMLPQIELKGTGTLESTFAHCFYNPSDLGSIQDFVRGSVTNFATYPVFGGTIGPRWTWLALGLTGVLTLFAVHWAVRNRRGRFIAVFAFTSVLAFIILAGMGKHPFGGIRHCLPLTPGVLLLWAAGVERLARRWHCGAIAISLVLTGMMAYGQWHFLPVKHVHNIRTLLAALETERQPGDGFVNYALGPCTVIDFYRKDYDWLTPVYQAGYAPGAPPPGPDLAECLEKAFANGPRVWIIEFPGDLPSIDESVQPRAKKLSTITTQNAKATLWLRQP